jgi:hypothetical protein
MNANWMLGIGQALQGVGKSWDDFQREQDAKKYRNVALMDQTLGSGKYDSPEFVKALQAIGVNLPTGKPGEMDVAPTTGVRMPAEVSDAIQQHQLATQQRDLTFNFIKSIFGGSPQVSGKPATTPAPTKSVAETGNANTVAPQQSIPQQSQSDGYNPLAGIGGTQHQFDRMRMGMALKFIAPGLDDAILNEPVSQVNTVDEQGNRIILGVPQSQMVGAQFKAQPTADVQNRQAQAKTAIQIIGGLKDLADKAGFNQGEGLSQTFTGAAQRFQAGMNNNPAVQVYQSQVEAMIPVIARALGHTGVLTEQDVAHAAAAFPKLGDSHTVAQAKWAALQNMANAMAAGGDERLAQSFLSGGQNPADIATSGPPQKSTLENIMGMIPGFGSNQQAAPQQAQTTPQAPPPVIQQAGKLVARVDLISKAKMLGVTPDQLAAALIAKGYQIGN